MNIFQMLTPLTYWLLVAMWIYILGFLLRRLRSPHCKRNLINTLIIILAINAFRTLFESVYFGAWYTSRSGFLPIGVYDFLVRPEIVIIPKLLNVSAAALIIGILLYRWFPAEKRDHERLESTIKERTDDLEKRNEQLRCEIAERRQAEETLRVSEEQLHMVFEVVDDIAFVMTDLGGKNSRVLGFSAGAEKIFGYTPQEIIGKKVSILHPPNVVDEFPAMQQVLREGRKSHVGETVLVRKSGEHFPAMVTIYPRLDATGDLIGTVGVSRDITEQKSMEEQLHQAQKMQSIGQLVAGIAHDFNNLMQVVNGYAELARGQIPPEHAAAESIDQVALAGDKAKELVKQLLAFSRQQVIKPVGLDLNEEIEKSQKMLRHMIGEHIQFEFIAAKDLGGVFADKGQVQQVLMNLCVNAHDAMPDGGTLTIETKDVSIAPQDLKAYELTRPGRYVLFSITDTGCGMDKATCEKVFEPFFTTKEVGKGTGLGLSTVYGIVKQNSGHITVYSELGEGTTFKIYLPISNSLSAESPNSTSATLTPAGGGMETILVVEDDEIILKLATEVLSGAGYTVLTAEDGVEAVRVFEEHADEIDLVMMDVVMPRMGGKEAMEKLLEMRPALRHLFVSGYSLDAGHNDFIQENNLHLLSKPYPVKVLLQKIRDVLEG